MLRHAILYCYVIPNALTPNFVWLLQCKMLLHLVATGLTPFGIPISIENAPTHNFVMLFQYKMIIHLVNSISNAPTPHVGLLFQCKMLLHHILY